MCVTPHMASPTLPVTVAFAGAAAVAATAAANTISAAPILTSMQRYLENVSVRSLYFGSSYLAVGEAA